MSFNGIPTKEHKRCLLKNEEKKLLAIQRRVHATEKLLNIKQLRKQLEKEKLLKKQQPHQLAAAEEKKLLRSNLCFVSILHEAGCFHPAFFMLRSMDE